MDLSAFRRISAGLSIVLLTASAAALGAARDVQFRSIDFEASVLELFNFGESTELLDGWRFCSHDDDQLRRYSSSAGLNGVSIAAGESLFIHFDNDASGDGRLNASSLGNFALPLDRGPYGLGLFINSGFSNGANLVDHLQWSIDGVDNTTADERSDEAEGNVWTDQNAWVATTPATRRLLLNDLTGGEIHGPADYDVIEPVVGDYSGNGVVGVEDYELWRATFGSSEDLAADGNGDSLVDTADYTIWRDAFSSAGTAPPAPEPSSALLVGYGLSVVLGRKRQRPR